VGLKTIFKNNAIKTFSSAKIADILDVGKFLICEFFNLIFNGNLLIGLMRFESGMCNFCAIVSEFLYFILFPLYTICHISIVCMYVWYVYIKRSINQWWVHL